MTEIHVHLHVNEDSTKVEPSIVEQLAPPTLSETLQADRDGYDEELLWARIGQIRSLLIEDLNSEEMVRERRQAWVAGMLQAIEILRRGYIDDVSEEIWAECDERFPFPEQDTELGSLADYRDLKPEFIEKNEAPEEFKSQSFARTISPVEAAADPELRQLVSFVDATGEEPDAVVSEELFDFAAEHLSDNSVES